MRFADLRALHQNSRVLLPKVGERESEIVADVVDRTVPRYGTYEGPDAAFILTELRELSQRTHYVWCQNSPLSNG